VAYKQDIKQMATIKSELYNIWTKVETFW